jgi:hypothetical protein
VLRLLNIWEDQKGVERSRTELPYVHPEFLLGPKMSIPETGGIEATRDTKTPAPLPSKKSAISTTLYIECTPLPLFLAYDS